jgi:ABC-type transport system substrate-binding protein
LYGYHPDQAKKLLADAGYPAGFQANCTTISTYVDYLSLLVKYWADIGVKVTLDVKETAAYTALVNAKQHAELTARFAVTSVPFKMYFYRAGTPQNMAMIKDDKLEETYVYLSNNYFDYATKAAKFKELIPYILEQCWYVYSPSSSTCAFWQPWVGGYHGENSVGYNVSTNYIQYLWIDQALKKKMGK